MLPFCLIILLPVLSASPHLHCSQYGICKSQEFLPAPPGKTPPCARPGATYCENVDNYPKHIIRYLIEKWGYDFNTLLGDESTNEFNDRRPHKYGPHVQDEYGPPPALPYHQGEYQQPPLIQPAITYGPISFNITQSFQDGYPDRRYKIYPHLLTNALQYPTNVNGDIRTNFNDGHSFAYSATVLPSRTEYNPSNWWKRSWGSENKRSKRQVEGSTDLCPTTSQFVTPRAALNTDGNWMFTVNLNEARYRQTIKSETCIQDECSAICSIPNGYSARCEQRYVQKRLVALEGGGDVLYTDNFWIPHCCVCKITPN